MLVTEPVRCEEANARSDERQNEAERSQNEQSRHSHYRALPVTRLLSDDSAVKVGFDHQPPSTRLRVDEVICSSVSREAQRYCSTTRHSFLRKLRSFNG